ncbi:MAG: LOG family protein, partial [Candidatus Omnitrophica bacterium]|nr:LOG family protein [Candidatus Omnitrophota bacterium]
MLQKGFIFNIPVLTPQQQAAVDSFFRQYIKVYVTGDVDVLASSPLKSRADILEEDLKKFFGKINYSEYITPLGEKITYTGDGSHDFSYLRAKDVFIIEARYYRELKTLKSKDDIVLFIAKANPYFSMGYFPWTLATLIALQRLNLKKKIFVDFGCGEGILALAAAKLGAGQAIGIDYALSVQQVFFKNVELNPSLDNIFFILEKFENLKNLKSNILEKIDIATLNLETFGKIYFSHLEDYLRRAYYVILSGAYYYNFPHCKIKRRPKEYSVDYFKFVQTAAAVSLNEAGFQLMDSVNIILTRIDFPEVYPAFITQSINRRSVFKDTSSSPLDNSFLDDPREIAKFIARASQELKEKFKGVGPAVSIWGSARALKTSAAYQLAQNTAKLLVQNNIAVITGGGPGIMEAANRGASEVDKSFSLGARIKLSFEQESNHFAKEILFYRLFFTRKLCFINHSIGFIGFNGGFGTLDEIFEAMTLKERGYIRVHPIILEKGFYTGLEDLIIRMGKRGLLRKDPAEIFALASTEKEIASYFINRRYKKVSTVIDIKEALSGLHQALLSLKDLGSAVSILGAGSIKPGNPYFKMAQDLARSLSKEGITIIYRGRQGISEAISRTFNAITNYSIKAVSAVVSPRKTRGRISQTGIYKLYFPHNFAQKTLIIRRTNLAYVFFPGGLGTMDLLFDVLCLIQTKKILPVPVILIDSEYWQPWDKWFRNTLLEQGCINKEDLNIYKITDTPKEAKEIILTSSSPSFCSSSLKPEVNKKRGRLNSEGTLYFGGRSWKFSAFKNGEYELEIEDGWSKRKHFARVLLNNKKISPAQETKKQTSSPLNEKFLEKFEFRENKFILKRYPRLILGGLEDLRISRQLRIPCYFKPFGSSHERLLEEMKGLEYSVYIPLSPAPDIAIIDNHYEEVLAVALAILRGKLSSRDNTLLRFDFHSDLDESFIDDLGKNPDFDALLNLVAFFDNYPDRAIGAFITPLLKEKIITEIFWNRFVRPEVRPQNLIVSIDWDFILDRDIENTCRNKFKINARLKRFIPRFVNWMPACSLLVLATSPGF